jgi:hypothetical protein
VVKTHRKAQLCGQNLPAKLKNNKAKARDLSAYIVNWADLSADQRKELDNTTWGPQAPDSDKDINKPDSDKSMSGNPPAGGSRGGAPGGGGGPPGGGGGGGGGELPPIVPAPPPTLDNLTRLVADIGNAIRLLAQQVMLMAARPGGRGGNSVTDCLGSGLTQQL